MRAMVLIQLCFRWKTEILQIFLICDRMRVWSSTKVCDNRGEVKELAIKRGADAASLGKLVEGTNQEGLCLAAIKLEVVLAHPGADVT